MKKRYYFFLVCITSLIFGAEEGLCRNIGEAIQNNNLNAIQFYARNTGIHTTCIAGISPLHFALFCIVNDRERREPRMEAIMLLLKSGANTNTYDTFGSTPLHTAAFCVYPPLIKALLKRSTAAINIQDREGFTPLDMPFQAYMISGERNEVGILQDVITALLDAGANPNLINKAGTPLLHYAVRMQLLDIVRLLLENGASVDTCDTKFQTALHLAVVLNMPRVVEIVLTHGPNVFLREGHGLNPFHLAATLRDPEILEMLVDHQPNLLETCTELTGYTALMIAAQNNLWWPVHTLLLCGANIDARDYQGRTALHHTAVLQSLINCNSHNINLLLKYGANPFVVDQEGHMPCDLAFQNKPFGASTFTFISHTAPWIEWLNKKDLIILNITKAQPSMPNQLAKEIFSYLSDLEDEPLPEPLFFFA